MEGLEFSNLKKSHGAFLNPGLKVFKNSKIIADEMNHLGYNLVSGGTDTHLVLIDLTNLDITGKLAENSLEESGITVNKNMIPFDERKPNDPSGIRIGTPALTTRKMGVDEMKAIAQWMISCLKAPEDTVLHQSIQHQIVDLCKQFPVPEDR